MEDQVSYQNPLGMIKTIKSIVVCPTCKGEGSVQSRKFFGHTEGWVPVNHTCPTGEGRRNLRRITQVSYEKL